MANNQLTLVFIDILSIIFFVFPEISFNYLSLVFTALYFLFQGT